SAGSEAARAYLAARRLGAPRLAVLVQPQVEAVRLGVLHARFAPTLDLRAEERAPDEPEWGVVAAREVSEGEPLAVAARRMAALLGGAGDAVDVEYALTV